MGRAYSAFAIFAAARGTRVAMLVWTSIISRPKWRSLLSASAFVLVSLFVVHLANFYGWTVPWMVGAVAALLLTLRSVGACLWFLSRHPFSVCDLGLSEAAWPGGSVRAAVRIRARRPVTVAVVRVTLTAERRDRDGTTRRLFHAACDLLRWTALRAGGSVEAAGELNIPAAAPVSYRLEERRVRWEVVAQVEAGGASVAEERVVIPVTSPP